MVGVRGVEDGGVPHTFELDFFPGDAAGIVKIAGLEHREYRRKLFMREGFCRAHCVDFTDEDFRFSRHRKAGHRRDIRGFLSDNSRVEFTVFHDGSGNLFPFNLVQDVRAAEGEFLLRCFVHVLDDDNRLLARADHAVVERLAQQDRVDRHLEVAGFVDYGRGVSRADADRRLARRIGCLDHAGAAGCQNEIDAGMLHERRGKLDRRLVYPADDVRRGAGRNRRVKNDAGCFHRTLLCPGMG